MISWALDRDPAEQVVDGYGPAVGIDSEVRIAIGVERAFADADAHSVDIGGAAGGRENHEVGHDRDGWDGGRREIRDGAKGQVVPLVDLDFIGADIGEDTDGVQRVGESHFRLDAMGDGELTGEAEFVVNLAERPRQRGRAAQAGERRQRDDDERADNDQDGQHLDQGESGAVA